MTAPSASDAAIAQFATATGLSVEEVKKLDAGAKPTAQIEKIAGHGQDRGRDRESLRGNDLRRRNEEDR